MSSSIIYEFKRNEYGKTSKDSIVIMGGKGFPNMDFYKNSLNSNEYEKIYYKENYGSICCPRDYQLDNKPTRAEFIAEFEQQNNLKIIDTYTESIGEEGEINYYYTLNNISNNFKLLFILKRKYARILNRKSKKIGHFPQIYTPFFVKTNQIMNKI